MPLPCMPGRKKAPACAFRTRFVNEGAESAGGRCFLTGPTPHERDRGVALVHELRMLTPARDVLRIRIDARSGDFLEVAGAGLTKARRKGHDR